MHTMVSGYILSHLTACCSLGLKGRLKEWLMMLGVISLPPAHLSLGRSSLLSSCSNQKIRRRGHCHWYCDKNSDNNNTPKRAKLNQIPICSCTSHEAFPRTFLKMMSMNSKQAFSMHPMLHEPKYGSLHTSSEAIRRACLQAPQVSVNLFGSFYLISLDYKKGRLM